MEDAVCYLIGGAPRTGKTTLGEKIAKMNDIKSLSTDAISVMMAEIVSRKDYPNLFYREDLNVGEFYEKYDTPAKAVEAGVKAGQDTEKAVLALIKYILPTWKVIVIEGVFITPGFVRQLQHSFPKLSIDATFLFDDDKERIKKRVYAKRNAQPYSDAVKLKEVEYIAAYNEWFRKEADRYEFDITEIK